MAAMQSSYSAKELAALSLPCLPGSERAIQIKAKRNGWASIKQPGLGGSTTRYLTLMIPEEIRLAIAVATAINKINHGHGPGASHQNGEHIQSAMDVLEKRYANND